MALNTTVEYDEQLMEMNNGELAGLLREEARRRFGHLFVNRTQLPLHESFPGGETAIHLRRPGSPRATRASTTGR